MSGFFELLEHTADIGIAARGATREELFAAAARGLRAVISSPGVGEVTTERIIEVSAGDGEELMVNWLNEILFLFETGFFPVDFVLDAVTETTARGRVRGEPFDPERHPVEREVKAATFHQIRVEAEPEGWRAQIYLDL